MIRRLFLAAALPALAAAQSSRTLDPGVTEQHIMVPMRDGVRLSTYLYTPPGKGPWPVLYEQRYANLQGNATRQRAAKLASHGYVVAEQNFRGTQLSEGVYAGYRALGWGDRKDGYDSVEWLAKQSWSNGKVGTFGGSQAGYAQNFLAVTQPPHLVCQFITDGGLSLFHLGYRIGGITRPRRFEEGMVTAARDKAEGRRHLEMQFEHPNYDDYWRQEDCRLHFDKMNVPAITVASWYDFMNVGGIETFMGREHNGGPQSRGSQKLVIGPWLHGGTKSDPKIGDLQFPENSHYNLDAEMIRWFDARLKGKATGVEKDATVRYYVAGAAGEPGAPGNVWREAPDWPVKAQEVSYYLGGDGALASRKPEAAASSTAFSSDPRHPAPMPGRNYLAAKDGREYERHPDVRTFTTAALAEPVEWTGKAQAELYVSSDARDTDFIVRVSDVYPDGRSIMLADAIRRARYRDSFEKPTLLEPGKVYRVAFDIGWMSQIFNRGHRIRVTIGGTGADFYEPNPNTGERFTIAPAAHMAVAHNTLFHDRQRASRVIAPVRRD
jgi:predicted acyl esterase